MLKVIIVYLFLIFISILVGLNIRINSDESSLYRGTTNRDVSLTKEYNNVKRKMKGGKV